MEFLYVLQLENNKYYIGATNTPIKRYKSHLDGKGPRWTQLNKPIDIIEIKLNCDNYSEQNTTLDYMKKYGTENVRGGQYTNCQLKIYELQHINKSINSADNKCYRCGEKGHYIDKCKSSSSLCCIDTSKLHITYAKNNKVKCFICNYLIDKNELKIGKYYIYNIDDSNKWAHYKCYNELIGNDIVYEFYDFAKNDKIKCNLCNNIINEHELRFGYEKYSKKLEKKKKNGIMLDAYVNAMI